MRYSFSVCSGVCLMLLGGATATGRTATAAEDCALAQRFIVAYFLQDYATVRTCVPANVADMFMAYPFAAPPSLSRPKVHKHQAVVEFSGVMLDGRLLTRGGIVFYKTRDANWHVREILFYNKIPAVFGFPSKSENGSDRAQEARVAAVAQAFMGCWQAHNMGGMLSLWYNWPTMNPDRVHGLSMSDFHGAVSATAWNDPYVSFSVKVTYRFGPFRYSMVVHGGLILVQARDGLKVRANHMVLVF